MDFSSSSHPSSVRGSLGNCSRALLVPCWVCFCWGCCNFPNWAPVAQIAQEGWEAGPGLAGGDNFPSLHLNSPSLSFCFHNIQEVEGKIAPGALAAAQGFLQ